MCWVCRTRSISPSLPRWPTAARRRRDWGGCRAPRSISHWKVPAAGAPEDPELYFEIQSLNEYGGESLLALQQAVERLIATVKTGNAAEFSAIMHRGRAYLDVRAAARAG